MFCADENTSVWFQVGSVTKAEPLISLTRVLNGLETKHGPLLMPVMISEATIHAALVNHDDTLSK